MEPDHPVEVRPRDWLVPVALVMIGEQGSSYGYELMERLARSGFEKINPGTLYRKLRRMESQGLVEAQWKMGSHGSGCRAYSTTEAGETYLASWAEGCEMYQRVLDAFYLAYYARRHQIRSDKSEQAS